MPKAVVCIALLQHQVHLKPGLSLVLKLQVAVVSKKLLKLAVMQSQTLRGAGCQKPLNANLHLSLAKTRSLPQQAACSLPWRQKSPSGW